jgi:hypothetical protein
VQLLVVRVVWQLKLRPTPNLATICQQFRWSSLNPRFAPPVPALGGRVSQRRSAGLSSHSSVSDEATEDPPSTDDSEAENFSCFNVKSAAGDLSAIPWRHLATKKYHLPKADELGRLGCGKMISYQYEQVTVVPSFLFPRCEVCFGNALHTYVTPSSSSGQS